MSSLSTTMPTTSSVLFQAPKLYAFCKAKSSPLVPLNVACAYKSTPSGQSTPLSEFPSYLPPGSLLSRIATNEKYRKQEEHNALAHLLFDSLDNEISTPVDLANGTRSHYHLPSFFNDVHFECELIHPRPKAYPVATRIMIKEFEAIAQKEAEGVEKAWECHYRSQYCWPGRSDSDEIVDITNALAHRCSSTKSSGRKWYQVLEEEQTTRQHIISPAPSAIVYHNF